MLACLKNSLPDHNPWHFSASHIPRLPFALHHLHCLRLHRTHCTGRDSGFPLTTPLLGWADRLVAWQTTHNLQVMSPRPASMSGSEYTPINTAVRRENFDIERDLKFSLFEDFDHLLQRAVGGQRSVASACVDEFGFIVLRRETSASVRVDHRVIL